MPTPTQEGQPALPSGRLRGRWHAIAANYGQSYTAEASIRAADFLAYHPLHCRRYNPRRGELEPLFPGYLFAFFSPTDNWARLCSLRGVYAILGAPGRPAPITDGVIEELLARTSERRVVDDPGELPEASRIRAGELGTVLGGPYAGLRGICTMSARARCSLLLSLFGRAVPVSLPVAQVVAA